MIREFPKSFLCLQCFAYAKHIIFNVRRRWNFLLKTEFIAISTYSSEESIYLINFKEANPRKGSLLNAKCYRLILPFLKRIFVCVFNFRLGVECRCLMQIFGFILLLVYVNSLLS